MVLNYAELNLFEDSLIDHSPTEESMFDLIHKHHHKWTL